jgi:hypothetical protein
MIRYECKDALERPGVSDGDRTRDNRSHNPVLYQLSYTHRDEGRQDLAHLGCRPQPAVSASTSIRLPEAPKTPGAH